MEKSLNSSLSQPEGLTSKFDPDDPMWSKHERVVRSQSEGSTFAPGFTIHQNDPISPPADDAEEDELREDIRQLHMGDDEEDLYNAD
jgi:hypothetical protein